MFGSVENVCGFVFLVSILKFVFVMMIMCFYCVDSEWFFVMIV